MSVFHNNALIGAGGGAAAAAAGGATKSLRFNSDHSSSLTRTPSSASNRRTFTFSCWVKRSKLGGSEGIFDCRPASGSGMTDSNLTVLYFDTDNTLKLSGAVTEWISTSQVFRDIASFYHIVLAVDTTSATASDRIKLYVNGSQVTDFGSNNSPSQNHEFAWNLASKHAIGSNTLSTPTGHINAYLADIYFIDGSQLDPTSFGAFDDNGVWQAAAYSGTFGTNGFHLLDFANESTVGHDSSGNDNDFAAVNFLESSGQYINAITGTARSGFPFANMFDGRLDHGALPAASTSYTFTPTTSIPFSTLHIYAYKDSSPGQLKINGTDVTSQVPNHNGIGPNQRTQITGISSPLTSIQNVSLGNLANVVFAGLEIDGELLLDKASEIDVLFDVPTNGDQSDTGAGGEVSGNYATLNPLKKANISTSNGNLDFAHSGTTGNWQVVFSTIGMTSGKYYCEFTCADADSVIGIAKDSHTIANDKYLGNDPNGWGYNGQNGQKLNNSSGSSYGNSFTSGDVIGIAFDATNGSLYFYKNGTAQNSGTAAFTGLTDGPYFFAFSIRDTGSTHSVNFGQRSWAYSAPSNYVALNTVSLPTPTIADGSDYFDAKLHTGNGSTQTISGFEFSPDFVWVKQRNTSRDHRLANIISGTGKDLRSNANNAEITDANGITAFNSDGFSVGSSTGWNQSSGTYVSFAWDAGSSTASNTDGSITSSVRANQTAGFSIVSWTSSSSVSTVGHGLSDAPYFIVTKNRSVSNAWWSYHFGLGNTKAVRLDSSDAPSTMSSTWNNTSPTSSVFTVGGEFGNGNSMIAYCFAPVSGYSAVGSYTGTGSINSTPNFIYTGFRPRFWMHRRTDSAGSWMMLDAARDPYNVVGNQVYANLGNAEGSGTELDFLSNGVRMRASGSDINGSGVPYIYMCFAENPFQANGGLAR